MTESLTATPKEQKLIVVTPGRPAYPVKAEAAFGIDVAGWRALVDAVWPSASSTESVILALSYCKARKLDPFKRPIHIVPVWDSKRGGYVETIWPGIGELRTTASRTGQWAGLDEAMFGPELTRSFKGEVKSGKPPVEKTVTFPEWAQVTVYKIMQGQRVPFHGPKVRWLETYATMGKSDVPNEMWESRPYGQLEKCAEAAALRRAFPEEVGNEYIPEEIGRSRSATIDVSAVVPESSRTELLLERLKGGNEMLAEQNRELEHAVEEHEISGPVQVADDLKPPAAAGKSRDELVDEIRGLLAEHFPGKDEKTKEAKADAILSAFAADWLKVVRMDAAALEVGLAALHKNLSGLQAMRAEREPGLDPGTEE